MNYLAAEIIVKRLVWPGYNPERESLLNQEDSWMFRPTGRVELLYWEKRCGKSAWCASRLKISETIRVNHPGVCAVGDAEFTGVMMSRRRIPRFGAVCSHLNALVPARCVAPTTSTNS